MAKNSIRQDEIQMNHSNLYILKRLSHYLLPFKLKIVVVVIMMIFAMLCDLINPYLMQLAIDKYIGAKNIKGLVYLGIFMLCLITIIMFISRIRVVMMASVTNKILLNIRHELYTHIQKLSFTFFDDRPVGKILARIIGDVNSLQELFTNSVTSFIPDILSLICVTLMMFYMNYKLAAAAIVILPFLLFCLLGIETVSRKKWQVYRKKRSNVNAFTHESFSGIKVTQSFAVEDISSINFKDMVYDMMFSFMKAVMLNDFFWPLVEVSWGIGSIIVYWVGVHLINVQNITVGTLVAFTMYIGMFWRPIMEISNFYNTLITNFAAAERIFDIMDIDPDIVDSIKNIKMPKIIGQVEFKNVTFSYDQKAVILENISFKVNPGETVALVGPTGAGKTTIVNLLSRFYEAQKGEVLIDGKNVENVELDSLRSQMGIMLQDTFLFSASIMENIRYGRLDATDQEVIASAKAVNAHGFILKLEDGYNTNVNERGSRLSVGQRQLISFARALLANPRILILDEATSNIDTVTEQLVQRGIEKLLSGRTSFVIAHRLSTIRDCDRIMVINNGQIAESGRHGELLKLKGLYYDLYMSQYRFLSEGA